MGLTLLVGPANAGKVTRLLDRYLAALDREPTLIVPNRPDVDRVERELLERAGALVGGRIGTFDDLFDRVAGDASDGARPLASDAQRALLVRDVVASARLNGLARSASSTAPTAPGSTGSTSGIGISGACAPWSGFGTTSPPGTRSRSSPTASRT